MDDDKKKEIINNLFDSVKREFTAEEGVEVYRPNKATELLNAQLLIEHMEAMGADTDEMLQVLKYMAVVINMDKDNLDILKAYNTLGIDSLIEKYIESMVDKKMEEN